MENIDIKIEDIGQCRTCDFWTGTIVMPMKSRPNDPVKRICESPAADGCFTGRARLGTDSCRWWSGVLKRA